MPVHLDLSPPADLISRPLHLRLTGLNAGQVVEVRAESANRDGVVWSSRAAFQADPDGTVDVGRDPPLYGSYAGVDPQGLIWSMTPVNAPGPADVAVFWLPEEGFEVRVDARVDGVPVASGVTFRRARLPDLREQPVTEGGLNGVLYAPPERVPLRGAVLNLGGSEGGRYPAVAALLASEGFLVLNLAYFGLPGLPEQLINIPLESFGRAVAVLREQPDVQGRRVGVTGGSKGAEAALLIGAHFPQDVGAAAAIAPGGMVFAGIDRTGSFPPDRPMSSWSLGGQPLPYLPYDADWNALYSRPGPVSLTPVHEASLRGASAELREAAAVPAERIQGEVLLVSGGDDRVWNAHELGLIAQERRERAGLPVRHLTHPQAGHMLSLPGLPTFMHLPTGGGGGTPAANADLQFRAWAATLDTLASVWEES